MPSSSRLFCHAGAPEAACKGVLDRRCNNAEDLNSRSVNSYPIAPRPDFWPLDLYPQSLLCLDCQHDNLDPRCCVF